jgi:hypothetical protein
VRSRKGLDGAAANESVDGRVRWNEVEDLGENPALNLFEPGLGDLDEAYAAGALGEGAVVVVLQSCVITDALEAPEIGEPLELFGSDEKPAGEFAERLDGRQVPLPCCRDGLHLLRVCKPLLDRQGMPGGCAIEASVLEQKVDYIVVARAGLSGEVFEVTACERAQPGPGLAKSLRAACDDGFCCGIAGEEGGSEDGDQRRIESGRQWSAPTSLTLRELVCERRGAHAMNSQLFTIPWGGPGETASDTRNDSSRLGALHC